MGVTSLHNLLITASVVVLVVSAGAGIYLLAWESAGEGIVQGIDLGNNWYQVMARSLGAFMIAMGILGSGALGYFAWRADNAATANDHLRSIAESTYAALEEIEDEVVEDRE